MASFDCSFPDVLTKLHEIEFDYDEGYDFEPYQEFQSAEENADWIKAWTGNASLTGSEYRIFGQDGTGGYAAFWLTRPDKDVLDQPIVFFGSEGELGVVASDFKDYLWILAGGLGPLEAIDYDGEKITPNADFTAFAEEHAKDRKKSPKEILTKARKEFPKFEESIRALCK